MDNHNNTGSYKKWAIALGCMVVLAAGGIAFALRDGAGGAIAQKSGAIIAGAWQNLFGTASYDINPDGDTVTGDDDASGTPDASDFSPDEPSDMATPPATGKTTGKSSSASSAKPVSAHASTSSTSAPVLAQTQNQNQASATSSGTSDATSTENSSELFTPASGQSSSSASSTVGIASGTQATSSVATTTQQSEASSTVPVGGSGEVSGTNDGTGTGGTASSTQDTATTSSTTFCAADHVAIAEIQIAGASSANDFIKIYNPTVLAVDMSGWKLRKKTSGGTDTSLKVFGAGSVIDPDSYFTWANSGNGFAASVSADVSSSATLAADNSVALLDASGTIIDEVAWGTGTNQYVEGDPFPTNPAAQQVLVRAFLGAAIGDSDDNAVDFTLH